MRTRLGTGLIAFIAVSAVLTAVPAANAAPKAPAAPGVPAPGAAPAQRPLSAAALAAADRRAVAKARATGRPVEVVERATDSQTWTAQPEGTLRFGGQNGVQRTYSHGLDPNK